MDLSGSSSGGNQQSLEFLGKRKASVLDDMLLEAHQCVAPPTLVLPWETPVMSPVFGAASSLPSLPRVAPAPVCQPVDEGSVEASVEAPSFSMQCLFQRFVVKPIAKKHVLDLSERQYMMAQRFELVLAHAYEASSLGRTIHHKSREERVDLVLQALGGKALNTLKARIRVASRMISWGVDQNMSVFPIDEQVVLEYTDFLVKDGARFSALTGVIETCQFLHHVLGVDMASRALSHPLLNGRIRKARLERPARKQARPFLASEVAALEHFVRDTSKPCQDRFAAGAMLFAIYSRSRIGDLKSIKDPVADITADKTGYLEVTSLSHKTRSMGNALGFELPLIAPVQGITDRPWGPAWLQACEESAHRFQDMLPGQPMIQSPLMAGGWSGREMSNAKFAHWVGAILSETGLQNIENFSGHSAKRTVLSWTSKFGLSMHTQAILGHHSLGKERTPLVYARDAQAAPIREMEGVLLQVRKGSFRPDLTRSGQMSASQTQAEAGDDLEANWYRNAGADLSDPPPALSWEEGSKDLEDSFSFPPEPPGLGASENETESAAAQEVCKALSEPGSNEDSSSSSSSSSSSEDSDAQDQDLREGSGDPSAFEQAIVEGRLIFQHPKTKTLHFLPAGASSEVFVCGRAKSVDHVAFRTKICSEKWFCKQCLAGRPIRDRGSLLRALEIAMAPK